jgi:hypothetical protein
MAAFYVSHKRSNLLLSEMNIPTEDTGTKNHLSNAKPYFCPEGCQCARGQNQHKVGRQSVPLIFLTQLTCLLIWIGPDQKFTIFSTG